MGKVASEEGMMEFVRKRGNCPDRDNRSGRTAEEL